MNKNTIAYTNRYIKYKSAHEHIHNNAKAYIKYNSIHKYIPRRKKNKSLHKSTNEYTKYT